VIALDSNVVLRFLVNDGSPQCAAAARFVERELRWEVPGFISMPVACEIYWVLERTYKLKREVVQEAFKGLLAARQIRFEREAILATVVAQWATGDRSLDFADALVHAIGEAEGCSHTVTFDKMFAGLEGVRMLV
jgi:predicted nucleic-acid-binding protein